jgi:hypothetical protein
MGAERGRIGVRDESWPAATLRHARELKRKRSSVFAEAMTHRGAVNVFIGIISNLRLLA